MLIEKTKVALEIFRDYFSLTLERQVKEQATKLLGMNYLKFTWCYKIYEIFAFPKCNIINTANAKLRC